MDISRKNLRRRNQYIVIASQTAVLICVHERGKLNGGYNMVLRLATAKLKTRSVGDNLKAKIQRDEREDEGT